jgi:hypothetical protein
VSADAKVQVVSVDFGRYESSASPPSRPRLPRRQDSPAWSTSWTNSAQLPGQSRHHNHGDSITESTRHFAPLCAVPCKLYNVHGVCGD